MLCNVTAEPWHPPLSTDNPSSRHFGPSPRRLSGSRPPQRAGPPWGRDGGRETPARSAGRRGGGQPGRGVERAGCLPGTVRPAAGELPPHSPSPPLSSPQPRPRPRAAPPFPQREKAFPSEEAQAPAWGEPCPAMMLPAAGPSPGQTCGAVLVAAVLLQSICVAVTFLYFTNELKQVGGGRQPGRGDGDGPTPLSPFLSRPFLLVLGFFWPREGRTGGGCGRERRFERSCGQPWKGLLSSADKELRSGAACPWVQAFLRPPGRLAGDGVQGKNASQVSPLFLKVTPFCRAVANVLFVRAPSSLAPHTAVPRRHRGGGRSARRSWGSSCLCQLGAYRLRGRDTGESRGAFQMPPLGKDIVLRRWVIPKELHPDGKHRWIPQSDL